jgi:hypothetical protein
MQERYEFEEMESRENPCLKPRDASGRDPLLFDYTKWRASFWPDKSIEEIMAMTDVIRERLH